MGLGPKPRAMGPNHGPNDIWGPNYGPQIGTHRYTWFTNINKLVQHLVQIIGTNNTHPGPYLWAKPVTQILKCETNCYTK